MWWWVAIFSLAALLAPSQATHVVPVNFDNYYRLWRAHDVMFVKFYAPWCGHCKALVPVWEQLAEQFAGRALIGDVDATEDLELAGEFSLKGYPSLRLFKRGLPTPIEYVGERDLEAMAQFVENWLGDSPEWLPSEAAAAEHLSRAGAVLGVFKGRSGPAKKFTELAAQKRGQLRFAAVDASAVPPLPPPLTAPGTPAIFIAAEAGLPLEALPVHTSAGSSLEPWLEVHRFPLLSITWESLFVERELMKAMRPMVQLFVDREDPDLPELVAALRAVAEPRRGRLHFLVCDAATHQPQLTLFRLANATLPRAAIEAQKQRYLLPGIASQATLEAFLADYEAGTLHPFLASQPLEEARTEAGLTTLIGATFHEAMAANQDKDLFVEFYSPNCGHCKALAPTWASLARSLAGVPTVVIARLDAAANEWDKKAFPVTGYPTLFLRPARKPGKKRARAPLEYKGGRTEDELLRFLRLKATHPIPDPLPPMPAPTTEPPEGDGAAPATDADLAAATAPLPDPVPETEA